MKPSTKIADSSTKLSKLTHVFKSTSHLILLQVQIPKLWPLFLNLCGTIFGSHYLCPNSIIQKHENSSVAKTLKTETKQKQILYTVVLQVSLVCFNLTRCLYVICLSLCLIIPAHISLPEQGFCRPTLCSSHFPLNFDFKIYAQIELPRND